jgi:hypothetical protein
VFDIGLLYCGHRSRNDGICFISKFSWAFFVCLFFFVRLYSYSLFLSCNYLVDVRIITLAQHSMVSERHVILRLVQRLKREEVCVHLFSRSANAFDFCFVAFAFDLRSSMTSYDLSNYQCQIANGDESLYAATRAGSFSKGLLHDSVTGIVDPVSFQTFVSAIDSGDFSAVVLAGPRKFVNPLSARALTLSGKDGQSYAFPPAPAFASGRK